MRFSRILLLLSSMSFLITSCAVGPDFQGSPQIPDNTILLSDWATLYQSPALNNLVQLGLKNNPSLKAAQATLKESQENLNAQIGSSLLPAINAQLTNTRQRVVTNASFGPGATHQTNLYNLYNASVNVSYTLDVFGGARRQIESLQAQVDYSRYELRAAYLTLTSNIVTTVFTIASLENQIQATIDIIQAQDAQLVILQKQFNLGSISTPALLAQETLTAQTRATLPTLQQQLTVARDALSTLVGRFPQDFALPTFNLNTLTLPQKLPVSVSSRIVQQRPDIQAQEALLHVASANVGVATANMYPQITLTGAYGRSSTNSNNLLFNPANAVWNLGAGLLQPLFQGGALHARRNAAVDAYKVSCAQYRQTVLQAFQSVADVLSALQNDAIALKAQTDAEQAAHQTLIITQRQYNLGGISYLALLNAQQQYQQTHISLIQAKATRFADTAALFQALGGGWWKENTV